VLADCNYPESRVTVVNNAIDDAGLHGAMQSLAEHDARSIAVSLGCSSEQVALFCGGLYSDKRLDFLLQAAHVIKAAVPDFELMVVGDGPDRQIIEQAAAEHSWIKYVGAKTGPEVAPYLAAAKLLLMPGLVGLVLLDSFIAGCPLVTTEFAHHSPEIAYLQPGVNGVVTRDDVTAYAAGVIGCLQDHTQLESLREGCRTSAQRYSMSAMVENFAAGIERCLARS
jgi:glycosyltransferase involved in cell wall biosynthesis